MKVRSPSTPSTLWTRVHGVHTCPHPSTLLHFYTSTPHLHLSTPIYTCSSTLLHFYTSTVMSLLSRDTIFVMVCRWSGRDVVTMLRLYLCRCLSMVWKRCRNLVATLALLMPVDVDGCRWLRQLSCRCHGLSCLSTTIDACRYGCLLIWAVLAQPIAL